MSRFFKSAAFPILIVVVLAFFAQRLISPNDEPKTPDLPGLPRAARRRPGQERRTLKQKNNTVEVELKDGTKYEVGFADDYGEELTETLLAAEDGGQARRSSTSRAASPTAGCRC